MSRPYLALIIGILATAFSAIFVAWAQAPGAIVGAYRMIVAGTILTLVLLNRRRLGTGQAPWRSASFPFALLGGFFFAGDLLTWNTAVLISGPINPTLMGNTAPIWVALGAVLLFRERLGRRFWSGLLLAVSGAMLILGVDTLADIELGLGTLLGVATGIFYGAYFLATQRGREQLDAVSYIWTVCWTSAFFLLLMALILGQPLRGYSLQQYLLFLALGVVTQVFGQFSFGYALGFLPASYVAPVALLQPVVTALLAVWLVGDQLTVWELLGASAILCGVYLVQRSRQEDG